MTNKIKLGALLIQQGKLSARDLERALIAQREMDALLGQVLVKLGLVSEVDICKALSEQLGLPFTPTDNYPLEPLYIGGLSSEFLFNNNLVPVSSVSGRVRFSTLMPQSEYLYKALNMVVDGEVEMSLGLEADIQSALQKYQVQESELDVEDEQDSYAGDDEFIEHLKDLASEAPVIRLVNQIIHKALDLGASDIHIEPFEDGLHLRYRVDGVIHEEEQPSASLAAAIASRIKLLAHLNIAERRLPQDGRIMTRVKGHELDLRVSTVPTVHGESIVMRVLDRQSIQLSLDKMGFSADTLARYESLLNHPHGVLLVTGPTGSGKTTTLYASLAAMDSQHLKIVTVEDPVEYQLAGINQIQVQSQIDLTFANALRSILRQDPDIIMIGEMRDTETAQIGVQSALTGHLVLSTLHTNTAAGAITRLEDMGVERYLITSAVNGVLAQRLIRTLCESCKTPVTATDKLLEQTGLKAFLPAGQSRIFQAAGCAACQGTGYSGRTSIHELFVLDDAMHKAILAGSDATTLHSVARKNGMITLYEDGLRKVAQGITSLEEVLRVTQDQSGDSYA